MPPRLALPPTATYHPQNDAGTYRDLLLFEERLKSNALSLQRRKSRYQLFLFHLLVAIAVLLIDVVFLPPEDSLLVIPYNLLLQRLLPHIYTPETKVSLPPYISSGLLFVAITTLVLFFASGMYTERIAYANRYIPHANRALRSLNVYLNVRKPPLRSKFKFLNKPLSFLFPRPESDRPQPKHSTSGTSTRPSSLAPPIRSRSPSAARPIPAIPPATNPRGELIFSSRVDRSFREGYERYRSAFEKMREGKERMQRRQEWVGWMTRWWWDTTPASSGTTTPVRTLSSSSTQRGRLSRSSTPPTNVTATQQTSLPQIIRQRYGTPPSSGLVRKSSPEGEPRAVL